ncbi:MAG: DUF2914 domain-containing protein [Desulfobacteraceae bacterium]|nr:MAG: DUF2914 domain-containing protein [Desulfobacteraceae bacterium]
MKRPICLFILVLALFLSPGLMLSAQETSVITIDEAVIGKGVVDRKIVDAGASFPADVGKLFCMVNVIGAKTPVEINQVWYFGETERAKVTLPIKSAAWRTFSSKIIQVHEVGKWRVDILDPDGKVLKTVEFEITK